MREPKKGEQYRVPATLSPPVCDREPAELDEPRLVGELLCLMPMLETSDVSSA